MGTNDYLGKWQPTDAEKSAAQALTRDGTWQRNAYVRQLLGDAFGEMTPSESDDITDQIAWSLTMGEPIDECAIGKVLAACVLRHLGVGQ